MEALLLYVLCALAFFITLVIGLFALSTGTKSFVSSMSKTNFHISEHELDFFRILEVTDHLLIRDFPSLNSTPAFCFL